MPQTNDLNNLHATALAIGDRGLLIRGASGSGKTTLAVALIAAAQAAGRNACLVSDDQVLLMPCRGRLVCRTPPAIAGLVEVRGATPQAIPYEPSAVIDLLVDLVEAGDAPRYSRTAMGGCRGLPAAGAGACGAQRPRCLAGPCRYPQPGAFCLLNLGKALTCGKIGHAYGKFGLVKAGRLDKMALPPPGSFLPDGHGMDCV